jgi:ATP-binding cassette subfamily F protein 3
LSLLEVANLGFGYTNTPLFSGVTFRLEAGERAALVAPNGAGKSTLLRVMVGELAPDQGTALIKKDARLGYYRQSHESKLKGSVMEALMSGFRDLVALRKELFGAQAAAASGTESALSRLAEATERYQHAGADALEHRIESIATKLGFSSADLERDVSTLSGGQRGRLELGVVLATEPDLLLLDEPTNHLDLETIRWLEQYLTGLRAGVLVVSHDRAFLDAVCPMTFELGQRVFRTYPLSYTAYELERAEDLAREQKQLEEQQAFIEKTEDFIRKNIAGQKTKQAQSRRKMLDKLERVERPEDVWARAERVRFRFAEAPRSGDIVLDCRGLTAERGDKTLFSGVDLLVRRGDRLGIVGPNGCGKTTLLRLMAARGAPEDGGEVKRGTNLREGYFDQHLGSLDEKKSAVEEVRSVRGDFNDDGARQYLARFRFYGDDPLRKVASFSGGERTRLALAKLLLEPRNLLFLDEPTNHLDIPAAEILEEALAGFEGSVILVSHDRRFLENVTTRTVWFESEAGSGATVDVYDGGFKDFVEARARAEKASRPAPAKPRAKAQEVVKKEPPKQSAPPPVKPDGDGEAKFREQKARAREEERKLKRKKQLEGEVPRKEAELEALRQKLREASTTNWEELHAWAKKERTMSAELDKLLSEWMELSEELSGKEARS